MKKLISITLCTGLIIGASQAQATPRTNLTDTFNRAANGLSKSDVERVDFDNLKPKGWDSPSFTRAADDLHNAVRKYNITSPVNPHTPTNYPPAPTM